MTTRTLIAALSLATLATGTVPCAVAQTAVSPKGVTAGDVVTKPLEDLNIKKDEIPPILLAAQDQPYTTAGLRSCPALQSEVRNLDAVLGDDIDVLDNKSGKKRTVGTMAKSLVGSLIPFGGVIREVTGANETQRKWNVAIYAGSVRRAFLKGYGQQKGCRYPARAATAGAIAAHEQTSKALKPKSDEAPRPDAMTESGGNVRFESRPVVQAVPRRR